MTIGFALLATVKVSASVDDRDMAAVFKQIETVTAIDQRVEIISRQFIDKPYHLGALGEGVNGKYDKNPLYRSDGFDCQTYVSTVVALSHSQTLTEFKQNIIQVRYANNTPRYLERNHFVSSDWNINNQKKGFIEDITTSIYDEQGKHVHKTAITIINKASWFAHNAQNKRQKQLINDSKHIASKRATIAYIPLSVLFHKTGKSNAYLFAQIPSGSIIEIVRPNWNLKASIGTNLNVSHLGIAIRRGNQLYFREASSVHKKVVEIPLTHYLKQYRNSKTIKGINIQRVSGNKLS